MQNRERETVQAVNPILAATLGLDEACPRALRLKAKEVSKENGAIRKAYFWLQLKDRKHSAAAWNYDKSIEPRTEKAGGEKKEGEGGRVTERRERLG